MSISKSMSMSISMHLCNITNMDIENYNVSDNTKVATVGPIYKKKSRNE